jgi:hypothetical protein
LGSGQKARAQDSPEPGPRAPRPEPRLTIGLRDSAGFPAPPLVRSEYLLDNAVFEVALNNGFPVRFSYRLELWRNRRIIDDLERDVAWDAVVRLDPLTNTYELLRTGGSEEHFTTLPAVSRALATPFTVDLLPPRPSGGRSRYYYVATLVIESLSLSELEEVERWLRGDFGPAIRERGDVGDALGRGARRLLIRFSGLPRKRLEVRSEEFRY